MNRQWSLRLLLVFAVSRAIYFLAGVRLDTEPLGYYLQYIDPVLLREHLWQSLFYLREQPPGFNLYLGLVLKATAHPEWIFLAVDLLMGLGLVFAVMSLMTRLGVMPWLAFLLTSLFTVSPITVLYELWVFYEYPVMVSLAVAAWALEQYARQRRFRDGLLYFAALAAVASIRGVFHLSWLLLLAAGLIWITRSDWKTGLRSAAVPILLVSLFYAKNFALFGELVPGQVYKKINYAVTMQWCSPDDAIERLTREGKISGILEMPAFGLATQEYAKFVKRPPPTGIPLLDEPKKSTGAVNYNSRWNAQVTDQFYRDAQVVAAKYPGLIREQVRSNVLTYLLPATRVYPFASSAKRLQPFQYWYGRVTSGIFYEDPDPESEETPIAWGNAVLFPVCLLGGALIAGTELRSQAGLVRGTTILFLLFNIVYDSAVTILFSVGDHNRYREEVQPLYLTLLGLVIHRGWVYCRDRCGNPPKSHKIGEA